jgi:hypothetical protein
LYNYDKDVRLQLITIQPIVKKRFFCLSVALFFLFFHFTSYALTHEAPLTLPEAERLAINQAPELQKLRANAGALQEQSVADGQLSDPQLIVGAANVPTNSLMGYMDHMMCNY